MTPEAALVIALIIIGVGFIGTVVPLLPGVPVVFAGILVYAILTGFTVIGPVLLVVFLVLTILAVAMDWLATALGAGKFGASKWGVIGALLGLLVGIFLFPPIGAFIGPIAGAIVFELAQGRTSQEAVRSGAGAFIGYIVGVVVDLGIAIVMTAIFLIRIIAR